MDEIKQKIKLVFHLILKGNYFYIYLCMQNVSRYIFFSTSLAVFLYTKVRK